MPSHLKIGVYKMDYVVLIGSIAGILSTISGLPQLIKIIKIRETRDLSLATMLIGSTASTLWLIYGFFIWSLPLVGSNIVGLSIAFATIRYKLKYH
jgi:MtN3 and saliva related transmembrane protein